MLDTLPLEILSIIIDYLDNTKLWQVSQYLRNVLANYRTPILYLYYPICTNYVGERTTMSWFDKVKLMHADKIKCSSFEFCNIAKNRYKDINIEYYCGDIYKYDIIYNGNYNKVMCQYIDLREHVDGVMEVYSIDKHGVRIEINEYSMNTRFKVINKTTREHRYNITTDMTLEFVIDNQPVEVIIIKPGTSITFNVSDYIVNVAYSYPKHAHILSMVSYYIVKDFMQTYLSHVDKGYINYLVYGDHRDVYVAKSNIIPDIIDAFLKYTKKLQKNITAIQMELRASK